MPGNNINSIIKKNKAPISIEGTAQPTEVTDELDMKSNHGNVSVTFIMASALTTVDF